MDNYRYTYHLIGLDVISGVIKATREHTIKSSVANIGFAKSRYLNGSYSCKSCRYCI